MQRPDIFLSCPSCLQETIFINSELDELLCKFCGEKFTYKDMARYLSNGYYGPCPECENGAMAFLKISGDLGDYICTKCGFTSDCNFNIQCTSCENIFWDENGGEHYLCEACHNSIYN